MFAKLTALSILALAVATYGAPCASESGSVGLPIPTDPTGVIPTVPGIPTSTGVVSSVTGAIPTGTGVVPTLTGVIPTNSIPVPGIPVPTGQPGQPGTPGVPGIPNVPAIPSIPGGPAIPSIPGGPAIPSIPGGPAIPSIPGVPTTPVGTPGTPPTSVPGIPPIDISIGPGFPLPTFPVGGNPAQTQSAKPTEGYPSPTHPSPPPPSSTDTPGGGNTPAAPGKGNGAGQCSTGPVQCCNKVVASDSKEGHALLAGLLGVDASHVGTGDLATDCSPINVTNISGGTCSAKTVCCQSTAQGGLVNIGCVPVTL